MNRYGCSMNIPITTKLALSLGFSFSYSFRTLSFLLVFATLSNSAASSLIFSTWTPSVIVDGFEPEAVFENPSRIKRCSEVV